MRKLITLIFIIICSWGTASAQFELTPIGFIDKANPDKNYLVLNFEGKSKADLYKSTLGYLNTLYSNPNETISKIDGESITVTALDDNTILTVNNRYSFSFEFKDGKIKVTPSSFLSYYSTASGRQVDYQIYSVNGKLKREKDKQKLENFYNGYVGIIKKNIEKKSEDW